MSVRQPVTDPGPFELSLAVKDLCEAAATLLRDQHNRIAAIERLIKEDPEAPPGIVM